MGSCCCGGKLLMKADENEVAKINAYDMEGYPFKIPTIYLDGAGETYFPQMVFDWSDDSVVLVRGKQVIMYTQSSFAELLAKDEEGNVIWMDGRRAPYAGCWKGEYLDEVRGAVEYTIVEYDLETSKKKKYKVTLEEETPFNYWDVHKLLEFVKPDAIKEKFVVENGMLTAYVGNDKDLIIPESVTGIGWHAFSEPSSFDSIVIPKTLVNIPVSMFEKCETEHIEVAEDNPKYCVRDGCLIDKETATLVWCFSGNTIPDDGSVKRVGPSAFYERADLENVILPEAVTEICSSAFDGCRNLKTVKFPDSLSTIGHNAFSDCDALGSGAIPEHFGDADEFFWPKRKKNDDATHTASTFKEFAF